MTSEVDDSKYLLGNLRKKNNKLRLLLLSNLSNEQSVPVILWKEHENAIAELRSVRQAVGKIALNWDHNLFIISNHNNDK